MDFMDALKALASEPRFQIMQWMRDPDRHFISHEGVDMNVTGVCVGQIARKLDMTQSTASLYLSILQRAGLLLSERRGKFTYYRRNAAVIAQLAAFIGHEL